MKKQDCQICKAFITGPLTYKTRKECGEQKKSEGSSSTTPTLADPSEVTLLGRVSSEKPSSVESTPTKKNKRSDGFPANASTAVNLLLMTSNLYMTSGVIFMTGSYAS